MKRIIIGFFIVILSINIAGCSSYYGGQVFQENDELVYEDIVNKIIRFHVIANSDSEEDQNLKLKVRDKVIEYVSDQLKECKDLNEARDFIIENKSAVEKIAEDVIKENGYSYNITSMLSKENFPDKVYGDLVFPQGEYEAYRILIGNAEGQNWWCVMFPPLCFVDETKEAVDSDNIKENLTKESKNIKENLKKEKDDKKSKSDIKFKFKFMELLFGDKEK